MCYYFNGIINITDLDLDNILLDEKSCEDILIYDITYKTPYCAKPLHIGFSKVDRYIENINSTKYDEKYEIIFDRIRHVLLKSNIQTFILINIQRLKLIQMMIYLLKNHQICILY